MTYKEFKNICVDFGYGIIIIYDTDNSYNRYSIYDIDTSNLLTEFSYEDIHGMSGEQFIDIWLELK